MGPPREGSHCHPFREDGLKRGYMGAGEQYALEKVLRYAKLTYEARDRTPLMGRLGTLVLYLSATPNVCGGHMLYALL